MNVLVCIKSGKQVSMFDNFGMFVPCENDNRQDVCYKLLISIFSKLFLISSLEQINLYTFKICYN